MAWPKGKPNEQCPWPMQVLGAAQRLNLLIFYILKRKKKKKRVCLFCSPAVKKKRTQTPKNKHETLNLTPRLFASGTVESNLNIMPGRFHWGTTPPHPNKPHSSAGSFPTTPAKKKTTTPQQASLFCRLVFNDSMQKKEETRKKNAERSRAFAHLPLSPPASGCPRSP